MDKIWQENSSCYRYWNNAPDSSAPSTPFFDSKELNNTLAPTTLYLMLGWLQSANVQVVARMSLLLWIAVSNSHLMFLKILDFHHITYTQDTFWAIWKGLCVKELCPPHQQFQVCMFIPETIFKSSFWYTIIFI